MSELYFKDIITRTRRADLPDECPKCGADLHGLNALVCEQFDATRQRMTDPIDGDVDWGSTEGVDGNPTIGYTCANCNHPLLRSEEVDIDVDQDWSLLDKMFDLLLYTSKWEVDVIQEANAKMNTRAKKAQLIEYRLTITNLDNEARESEDGYIAFEFSTYKGRSVNTIEPFQVGQDGPTTRKLECVRIVSSDLDHEIDGPVLLEDLAEGDLALIGFVPAGDDCWYKQLWRFKAVS